MAVTQINSLNNLKFATNFKLKEVNTTPENKSNTNAISNNMKEALTNPTEIIGRSQVNFKMSPNISKKVSKAATKINLNSFEKKAANGAIEAFLKEKPIEALKNPDNQAKLIKDIKSNLESNNKSAFNPRKYDSFVDVLAEEI